MKDLKNLKGAKILSKVEQKSINGGVHIFPNLCMNDGDCEPGQICFDYDSGNGSGVCVWPEDPILP
jgi:hypothetical protein